MGMICLSSKGNVEILIRRAVGNYKEGNFKDAVKDATEAVHFAKLAAEEAAERSR